MCYLYRLWIFITHRISNDVMILFCILYIFRKDSIHSYVCWRGEKIWFIRKKFIHNVKHKTILVTLRCTLRGAPLKLSTIQSFYNWLVTGRNFFTIFNGFVEFLQKYFAEAIYQTFLQNISFIFKFNFTHFVDDRRENCWWAAKIFFSKKLDLKNEILAF